MLRALCLALGLLLSAQAQAEVLTSTATPIDGDTLIIDAGVRVRLFGIDAPEHNQAGGPEALAGLTALVADQVLRCRVESIDYYRRTIASCRTAAGIDVNRSMVEQGLAWAYLEYSKRYLAEERSAACAHRGLWSGPFLPPWHFRHCN